MRLRIETGIFQASQKIWLPYLVSFNFCLIKYVFFPILKSEFIAGVGEVEKANVVYICVLVPNVHPVDTLYCLLDRNFVVPIRTRLNRSLV